MLSLDRSLSRKRSSPRQTAVKCTPTVDVVELRNVAEAAADAGAKVLPVSERPDVGDVCAVARPLVTSWVHMYRL